MAHVWVIFLRVVVIIQLHIHIVFTLKECKKIDQCRCSTDEGEINLWSLAGKGSNIPRFHIQDEAGQKSYGWNPCNSWEEQDKHSSKNYCKKDTAVCQSVTPVGVGNEKWYFQLGRQSAADFTFDSSQNACILTYRGTNQYSKPSKVKIRLSCDKSRDEPTVKKVVVSKDESTFETVLIHKCACPGECKALSVGSILIIIFFSVLFVYLVGGVLFTKYHRGATGKELIPNYSFWSELPGLVKDGFIFTYRKLRMICDGSGKYDGL